MQNGYADGKDKIKSRAEAVTELSVFVPDLLLHAAQAVVLALQSLQVSRRGVGKGRQGVMQGAVLGVVLLECLGLFAELLAQEIVAHGRGCAAGAATAGGAGGTATLGLQVTGGTSSSCVGSRQSVRVRLAFQGVGSGHFLDTVGLCRLGGDGSRTRDLVASRLSNQR